MIKLESIMAETTRLLGISSRLEDEKIVGCWKLVLKEEQLSHTKALRFKRGVLYVGTTSPAWAHHMTMNKKNLLEELNRITSKNIKDIRFSSSGSVFKKSGSVE